MPQYVKKTRTKRLLVYYNEDEYLELHRHFIRSNSRHLSIYVRNLSLRRPVEVKNRNASFDDFIAEIVPLRKEMAMLRRTALLSPAQQEQLLDLHKSIQYTIDKIVNLCMPS